MPIITLALSTSPDAARSAQIAGALTETTARLLRKDPTVTAVAVTSVDPRRWFTASRSLAEQGKNSFWLDIKVVDGTNTKPELAAYLDEVWAVMDRLVGNVHEESYVLVHEVPAAAYGFGGKTQEHRFIAGRLGVPV